MKPLTKFSGSDVLNYYRQKTSHLKSLEIILQIVLESKGYFECHISNFENGRLTLVTSNASSATMIRYLFPCLTKELMAYSEFKSLEKIRCKVNPTRQRREYSQPKAQNVSATAGELLRMTATEISHPELKTSLLKLANTLSLLSMERRLT